MAQSPDIRVRLAPEGVREVVEALKRVQREGDDAARRGAGGVDALTASVGAFKRLLPTIGLAAATAAIVGYGRATINTADEMGKMAQRAGTTAESMSVLSNESRTADVSTEQLQGGLVRLVNSMRELREGQGESVEGFKRIGITARDIEGLDTAQVFALIATRLRSITNETERSEIALQIFGRRMGAQLVPLLNQLGEKGFAAATAEAQKFGVFISTDLAKQAELFNDNLTRIQQKQRGLAISLAGDLLPKLNDITGAIIEAANESGTLTAIWVALGGVAHFAFGVNEIKEARREIRELEQTVARTRAMLEKGETPIPFSPFSLRFNDDALASLRKNLDLQEKELKAARERLDNLTKADKTKPGGADAGGIDVAAKKALDVRQKIAEIAKKIDLDELKIVGEVAKQRQDAAGRIILAERAVLDAKAAVNAETVEGQKRIDAAERELVAARLANINAAYDSELRLVRIREDALKQAAKREGLSKADEIRVIDGIIRQSHEQELALARTRQAALTQLLNDRLARERQARQQIVALDKEIADSLRSSAQVRRDMALAGLSAEEQLSFRRREAVEVEAKLQEAAIRGNTEEARKQHAELVRLAQELGSAGGGRQFLDRADELLKLAADAAKLNLSRVADEAKRGAQEITRMLNPLEERIAQIQRQLVDVKVGLNQEALQAMIREIQDELAKKTFQIGVQPLVGRADGGSIPALASGGRVPGRSPSPRADNILMWGTAGEFMQPVRAVKYYGTDFMESIRRMELPRFADGGMVGGGAFGAGSGGDVVNVNLSIGGRSARLMGEREQVQALVDALAEVGRGT